MSEEILYIDDGELVYYINENEFVTCDEIPIPMLEGIKHLQQKVEQLEKENEATLKNYGNLVKEWKQLESIRKEAIRYMKSIENEPDADMYMKIGEYNEYKHLLNILNKGSE